MVIPESGVGCSRVTHPFATDQTSKLAITVRLACVKHAASVRPEPESNSPLMSTWHQPTKAGQQPTNETANPPLTKGRPIRFGRIRNPEPHGVRTRLQSQPRPTKRQAIWHRLLGTLLSSQGTDALSSRPAGPSREAFRFPAYQIVFPGLPGLPANRFPDSLSAFTTLAGFSSPPDHLVC